METEAKRGKRGGKPYRLTARPFLGMIDQGLFPPEARIELIQGILVEHPKRTAQHDFAVHELADRLREVVPAPWFVREGKSLELGRTSRIRSDIAWSLGPPELSRDRSPGGDGVGCLIEVADSTYPYDRGVKWRAFASAKIPAYLDRQPDEASDRGRSRSSGEGQGRDVRRVDGLRPGIRSLGHHRRPRARPDRGQGHHPLNRSPATMATDTRTTTTGVKLYRLSVDQSLAAIGPDILPESAPSELLGGILVTKMPKYPPQSFAIIRLGKYFHRTLPEPWIISEQDAVKLGRFWYPEPDIAIRRVLCRGRIGPRRARWS